MLSSDQPVAERFWALDKRIKEDRKRPGVIAEMSRGNMLMILARLVHDKVIEFNDLEEFSDELKDSIKYLTSINRRVN